MRKVALVAGFAVGLAMVGGCADADRHESAVRDFIGTVRDMNTALAGVKDKETLDKAEPRLEAPSTRMKDIQKRMEALGEPSKERQKQLHDKYQKEIAGAMEEMMGHVFRLARMGGGEALGKIFEGVTGGK